MQEIYYIFKNIDNYPGVIPKQVVVNVFDPGYRDVEEDSPEQLSALPFKKKRNLDLLQGEEKEYNKIHSRIVIEHIICRLKNAEYRVMYLEIG